MRANKLKLNVKKTKLLYFDKEGLCPHISVHVDGEEIQCVSDFKFLGIYPDNELKFTKYVYELRNRLNRTGFVIKKLGMFIRTNELKVLYFSHVHSILVYGISVWGTLTTKNCLIFCIGFKSNLFD